MTNSEASLALPLVRLTYLLSNEGLINLRFSRKICYRSSILRKWQKLNDGKAFTTYGEDRIYEMHQNLKSDLLSLVFDLPSIYQKIWLDRWRDKNDPLFHPTLLIDGNILKDRLGMQPGPELGQLLAYLSKEKAFGRLESIDEGLQMASKWLMQNEASL